MWDSIWFCSLKRTNTAICVAEMLGKTAIPCAHYLVENKIVWHLTHTLSNSKTLIPAIVLPANKKSVQYPL
jgi:hypothetical protein